MGIFKKTFLELFVVIGVLALIVLVLSFFASDEENEDNVLQANISGQELFLEVADNSFLQTVGLSGRETLENNQGMIFVYDDELEDLTFWMKNTLIPLDMIFLNSNLEIVYLIENVPICEKEPCPTYTSEEKAQYVIEVNAGWVEKNTIRVGDRVEITDEDLSDS